MSDDFRSAVESMNEPSENTASAPLETTATDQLAAEPIEGSPEPQSTPGDTAETAPAPDADLRSYLDRRKAERPELAEEMDRIYSEFHGAWTPKLQEAAELRKQMEAYAGLDPEIAPFMRQVNELALVDPRQAAALWDQAKEQLFGGYQEAPIQAQQPEVPEGWEYWTDNERFLYTRQQELETRLQQNEAWKQQETAVRNQTLMQQQFEAIKAEFGQEVPQAQKEAAARYCLQHKLGPDQVGVAWRGLYGASLARQMGRNEAAGMVERKTAMTPGPSAITNPPAGPEAEPTTLRGALEQAYGIRR